MTKRVENSRPIQMIDFDRVFYAHPKETFVGRKRIIARIDDFLQARTLRSPFLVIAGESGTGKTALLANYVRGQEQNIVFHFADFRSKRLQNPLVFAWNIYCALGWTNGIKQREYEGELETLDDAMEALQRRINHISRIRLRTAPTQGIVIDGLYECVIGALNEEVWTIADVLHELYFPEYFRVIISWSGDIRSGLKFIPGPVPTVIGLTENAEENNQDIHQYLRDNLPKGSTPGKSMQGLIDACRGNFQFASWIVEMANSKEIPVDRILDEPPEDLFHTYDLKLDYIRKNVGEARFAKIWSALLTMTLFKNASPQMICDILRVPTSESDTIFTPIAAFMDMMSLRHDPPRCTLSHRSIIVHILAELYAVPEQMTQLQVDIVDWLERSEAYRTSEIALEAAIFHYPWVAKKQSEGALQFLHRTKFAKYVFVESFPNRHPHVDWFLAKLDTLSLPDGQPRSIVLQHLLHLAYRDAVGTPVLSDELLTHTEQPHSRQTTEIADIAKVVGNDTCSQVRLACQSCANDRLSVDNLLLVINRAFPAVKREIKKCGSTYEGCVAWVDKCFPVDEKSERKAVIGGRGDGSDPCVSPIRDSDGEKGFSPRMRNETTPEKNTGACTATYLVHENLLDDRVENPQLVRGQKGLAKYLERKNEYQVWFLGPRPELCHYGNPVPNLEPRLQRLLKAILISRPIGSIYMNEMHKVLVAQHAEPISHDQARTQKEYLVRPVSAINTVFGKFLGGSLVRGKWRVDYTEPQYVFQTEFTYCLIEPAMET